MATDLKSVASGILLPDTTVPDYYVPTPVDPALVFSDSFDRANLYPYSSGGFSYAVPDDTSIYQGFGRTGNSCMKFTFPAGYSKGFAEQRLIFPVGDHKEIWIQWWLYYPDGTEGLGAKWVRAVNPTSSDNNKVMLLFSAPKQSLNDGTQATLAMEDLPYGTDTSKYDPKYSGINEAGVKVGGSYHHNCLEKPQSGYSNRGRWLKHRMYGKLATWTNGEANYDGECDLWVDEKHIFTGRNMGSIDCSNEGKIRYAPESEAHAYYEMCYFMGATNAAYDVETNVYIDDIEIATDVSFLS